MLDRTEPESVAVDEDAPAVARALGGDFAAFESLVGKYQDRIYGLALRMLGNRADAEDVVQETFVSLVEHLKQFSGRSLFSTWLMRIAANAGLMSLRKRRRRNTISLEAADGAEGELPHPEFIAPWREDPRRLAEDAEMRKIVEGALELMEEKYRLVFVLRDVEGFSTQETAQVMGISEANVKVRLLRARLMLRERLTREFGDWGRQLPRGHGES